MNQNQKKYRDPYQVISAAKQILRWYLVNTLMLFPYRLTRVDDCLTISVDNERGVILQQIGDEVESTLEPADYKWFKQKLDEITR